jgi:hypothetical protein
MNKVLKAKKVSTKSTEKYIKNYSTNIASTEKIV